MKHNSTPLLATERQRKYCRMVSKRCDCTHPDWLTCVAEREHTTRFNAMLLYTRCDCHCHRNKDNQQVSEQVWLRQIARNIA